MSNNQEKIQCLFQDIASACICFIPFLLFLALTAYLNPVTPAQYENSDPLVRLLTFPAATLTTFILGLIICSFWIKIFPMQKNALVHAAIWTLLGSFFSLFVLFLIYKINGPQLPTFIPPEESAESGLVLGLTAGMLEEILFRLLLLPLFIFLLTKKLSFNISLIIAVLLTALLFSLSHELAGDAFQMRFFVTRFIMPGVLMSIIFLKLHPAALLSGHTAAHISIAMLFTSQQ